MEFQQESFFDCVAEAEELMLSHAGEVGRFSIDRFELNLPIYEAIENVGLLRCYTARKDDKLVGYCTFFVTLHTHFKSVIVGVQDALFFDPACRGFSSIKFIKFCDDELQKEGVHAISRHVTCKKDYGKLLERLGYDRWEINYIREFGEVH